MYFAQPVTLLDTSNYHNSYIFSEFCAADGKLYIAGDKGVNALTIV